MASFTQATEWAETKQILAELRQCYQGTAGEADDAKLVGEIKAQNAKASRVIEERKESTKQVIQGAWMAIGLPAMRERRGQGWERDQVAHERARFLGCVACVCVVVIVGVVRRDFLCRGRSALGHLGFDDGDHHPSN